MRDIKKKRHPDLVLVIVFSCLFFIVRQSIIIIPAFFCHGFTFFCFIFSAPAFDRSIDADILLVVFLDESTRGTSRPW